MSGRPVRATRTGGDVPETREVRVNATGTGEYDSPGKRLEF